MKKKNNKILLVLSIAVFVCVLVMLCLTLMHYWAYWFGLKEWKIYASVNVTERKGFDLNGTALTFGGIGKMDTSTRMISLENNYNSPVLLKIKSEGKIAELLIYEPIIVFEMGEKRNVSISVITTNETALGFYEGYVNFKVVPAQ